MKIILVSLLGIMAITSCKKTSAPGHHITSSSNGRAGSFSSTGNSVSAAGAPGAKIVIEGTSSSGARMQITLEPYTGVTGTFPANDATVTRRCIYTPPSGSPVNASVYGTVTLTSVTPDIIGTFNFIGCDSSIFTGSFNAPMPE